MENPPLAVWTWTDTFLSTEEASGSTYYTGKTPQQGVVVGSQKKKKGKEKKGKKETKAKKTDPSPCSDSIILPGREDGLRLNRKIDY